MIRFYISNTSHNKGEQATLQERPWQSILLATVAIMGVISAAGFRSTLTGFELTLYFTGFLGIILATIIPLLIPRTGRSGRVHTSKTENVVTFKHDLASRLLGLTTSATGTVIIYSLLFNSTVPFLTTFLASLVGTIWTGMFLLLLIRPFQIILSPTEITVRSSFRSATTTIDWENFLMPRFSTHGLLMLPTAVEDIEVPLGASSTDPRIIASLIEFYRTNPALRSELGDGAAITRLRNGDLPITWEWPPPDVPDSTTPPQEPDQQ